MVVQGNEAAAESVEDLRFPTIPNHELLRCIGRGAYGEVWLARNTLGAFHAVKVVHRSSFDHSAPFDREFRGIQHYTPLSRTHHGLVRILHVGRNKESGYFYYVMELGDCEVNGQNIQPETYCAKNLANELDRRRQLPLRECLRLAMELAEALQYLHSRQLVHRDIKPSNIIYVDGVPKFADVGLVTHAAEGRLDTTRFLGTEGFVPPEGLGTPGADVFSLGKVLYEAWVGQPASAFPSGCEEDSPGNQEPAVAHFHQVICKACAPDSKQRYRSVMELQRDLLQLSDQIPD